MSSKRTSVAELERAAARYESIHERWNGIEADQATNAHAPPSSESAPRTSGGEPAAKTRESFPPPSPPPFRPAFDTLIGVPRNSFAPADTSKAPPASTEAVATPAEVDAPRRRSYWRLLLAAAAVGVLGAAAMKLGALERAEGVLKRLDASERGERLLARLRTSLSPDTNDTAQSVESLRANPPANGTDPERPEAPATRTTEAPPSMEGVSETQTTIVAAAAQQASMDAPIARATERAEADPTVPRSNTSARSAATTTSTSPARGTLPRRAPKAKNAPENPAPHQPLPRVMASASKSAGAVKDPRRSKPRPLARKPSRKTGQDGIIRQSPF